MPEVLFDSAWRDHIASWCFANANGRYGLYVGFSVYEAGSIIGSVNSIDTNDNAANATTGRLVYWPIDTVDLYLDNNGGNLNSYDNSTEVLLSASARAASASGVAAEFLYWGSPSTYGNINCLAITGTVSVSGGGGDVVIADTSIVSGQKYRLQNIKFQFFKDFTY